MPITKITTYIVDAFTEEPFKGNPAGVCLLENPISANQMQAIAAELGFSETAFVQSVGYFYSIRYFTPTVEIPLCGHATLGASKVLFSKQKDLETIRFQNQEGIEILVAQKEDVISMEFPMFSLEPQIISREMLWAFGLKDQYESLKQGWFSPDVNAYLIVLEDVEVLRKLEPNFTKLEDSDASISGVVLTAQSNQEDFDFESRTFWPWSGIDEDPVTGVAHTFLTSYWNQKLGKNTLRAFQCSARTGILDITVLDPQRIRIRGKAVIVLEGSLRV